MRRELPAFDADLGKLVPKTVQARGYLIGMRVRDPLPDGLAHLSTTQIVAVLPPRPILQTWSPLLLLPCWESQAESSHFPREGSNLMDWMYYYPGQAA